MNFQFYLEKLFDSPEFHKFKFENPDAFLCSGFFTIDFEGTDNQQHLDYYVPSAKKIFSFNINGDPIKMTPSEIYDGFSPEKISEKILFDMDEIESLIKKRAEKETIKNKVQKIILSLQNQNGKSFLLGTVFLSGLGLIKIAIDLGKKTITDFEKKSFFDMMKFAGKK